MSERVGGGIYKRAELLPGERIVAECEAEKKYFVPFLTSEGGKLVLTTERLIYLPTWWFLPSLFERRDCIGLPEI